MTVVVLLGLLPAGAWFVAVLEAWMTTGRFEPGAPLTAGIALLGQENVRPRQPDRILYETAPPLLLAVAVIAAAVLPLTGTGIVVDMATGALFINAALAYVMIALVIGGWGSQSAYGMVGGWRFLGQIVAYSMLIVMPIAAVAMRAESLSTTAIVESQAGIWNAIYQPAGFVVFAVGAMALAFLPPFDLPDAPSELAGGAIGEYTGGRYAIIRLARLILVVVMATSITVFYFGGWLGPLLPDWSWTIVKTLIVAAAMLLAGRYTPRVATDQLLSWSWKLGIPLALANIGWVGIILLLGA